MPQRRTVDDDSVVYAFSPDLEPAVTVAPGDALTVETRDSLEGEVQRDEDRIESVPEEVNAATGPIGVEGAARGDALSVAIEEVRLAEDRARAVTIPGFGLLQDDPDVEAPFTRVTPIEDGELRVGDTTIPLDPCIGTIGVATAEEEYSTLVPHDHGGNLDTTVIRAGATVYFPVFQPGGLLAMGDCKAAMADGEHCGTGAEVATEIDLTLDVVADAPLARPLVETTEAWTFLASAEDLETACELAVRDACEALAREHNTSFTDAYVLSSLVADLEISQVVDPLKTVRCAVPKAALENPLA
ncbi:acetamidase/formamidase family protein [Halomarina ordinaria]|uniref:Acetamidase/formamidase family protein n=1 Tax=Halomarina ordinaria TaxID=3033939 RepID=A0ABD5U889_9EURY|nr:acetamidase/formamidase family protein [Halomarina sp. PSRA2]